MSDLLTDLLTAAIHASQDYDDVGVHDKMCSELLLLLKRHDQDAYTRYVESGDLTDVQYEMYGQGK